LAMDLAYELVLAICPFDSTMVRMFLPVTLVLVKHVGHMHVIYLSPFRPGDCPCRSGRAPLRAAAYWDTFPAPRTLAADGGVPHWGALCRALGEDDGGAAATGDPLDPVRKAAPHALRGACTPACDPWKVRAFITWVSVFFISLSMRRYFRAHSNLSSVSIHVPVHAHVRLKARDRGVGATQWS